MDTVARGLLWRLRVGKNDSKKRAKVRLKKRLNDVRIVVQFKIFVLVLRTLVVLVLVIVVALVYRVLLPTLF